MTTRMLVLGSEVQAQSQLFDLGDGRVVKTGFAVSLDEARAMVFVRTYTSIPVPEVYMVFKHNGDVHIVMERVDGLPLDNLADLEQTTIERVDKPLSEEELVSIMHQLHNIVQELRDLGRRFPRKTASFGSWPEGPFKNSFFSELMPFKPFLSVDEFHANFLERLEAKYPEGRTYQELQSVQREGKPYSPLLTHGDLAPRNLLVKDGRIVAVLDWETFGWYPEFWEEMGIWNASIPLRLQRAIVEVFGERSFAADVYRYTFWSLAFPF
ncbi:kinase-like protein [Fomes fomentarius]|nr:kinase-like protein [Fomes fomentarius]